jgi:ubiquinone/menaquinone biosynthesis C-methylase UbiE
VNTQDVIDKSPVYTGERVIEGKTDPVTWQMHVARYQFASHYTRGRVFDIACGTGYGCKILLNSATTRIVGIDISQDAISEALKRYKDDRIAFTVGNILDIELPNESQDAITCFETIEHVDQQEIAISELCRVLDPNGTLIISCPNRKVTSPGRSASDPPHNPFHVKEFSMKNLPHSYVVILEQ